MRRDRSLCSSTSSSDRTEDRIKEWEKHIRTSTLNRETKACYAFRDRMCVAHPYARVCVCAFVWKMKHLPVSWRFYTVLLLLLLLLLFGASFISLNNNVYRFQTDFRWFEMMKKEEIKWRKIRRTCGTSEMKLHSMYILGNFNLDFLCFPILSVCNFCGIEQTNWLNPEQAHVPCTWFHYIHLLLPYVATENGEKRPKNKDRNHKKKKKKMNKMYTEKNG